MVYQRYWFAGVLFVLVGLCAPARAEVKVSLTFTGTVDELIPILQKIQELGLGGAPAANDPLKLNVHSVMSEEKPATAAPAEPAFSAASVEPATAKSGDSVLISVSVVDAGRHVDTVSAAVGELKVDLFDNGTEGDVVAGDHVWSRKIVLPALPAGEAPVAITAYNANGEAIQTLESGEAAPLTAQTKVTVSP